MFDNFDPIDLIPWGIGAFISLVLVSLLYSFKMDCEALHRLGRAGYSEKEISVFLRLYGGDATDFESSQAMRKQYAHWQDGDTTPELEAARSKKRADDARSEGVATGLAVGVAVGSSR